MLETRLFLLETYRAGMRRHLRERDFGKGPRQGRIPAFFPEANEQQRASVSPKISKACMHTPM